MAKRLIRKKTRKCKSRYGLSSSSTVKRFTCEKRETNGTNKMCNKKIQKAIKKTTRKEEKLRNTRTTQIEEFHCAFSVSPLGGSNATHSTI